MDAVERLSLAEAAAGTLIGCEHRHRYQLASRLCAGLRVADVCCGNGYGSAFLTETAAEVEGIDRDAEAVATARERIVVPGLSFTARDALEFLSGHLSERFDAIVMFEALEHLPDPDEALSHLRRHAKDGVKLLVSVPNSKIFRERNPHHTTDYHLEATEEAFKGFEDLKFLFQFHAEGSMIMAASPGKEEGRFRLDPHQETDYANHFIACVGFDTAIGESADARFDARIAPMHNRYMLSLEWANRELHETNARLARGYLGTSGSAAASRLTRVRVLEEELEELRNTPGARLSEPIRRLRSASRRRRMALQERIRRIVLKLMG